MIHKTKCLFVCVLILSFFIVACSRPSTNPPEQQTAAQNDVTDLNWQVPDFQAVDQTNKTVTKDTLKGKVWLTHFLFTRCPNICPPMTANLARVQKAVEKEGIPATMVSFTVDPEHDKSDVLKKFGEDHGANLTNWHFLTGYSFEYIQKIATDAFKGQVSKVNTNDPKTVLFNHPSQFYLVDQTGKVRKFYDGLKPNVKQLVADVKQLEQEGK
ncbi:SCO family protein [Shimazuella alba]|uniref:SCO family protein n=1 Tax=Shimazuella alba TaxID=2690964 RepID=A0A6I4VXE5_9BACL|nr:SCO family protein [Shimazuella alba]MXQ55351.1 SCO family protein [Shimazuella alba]